MSVYDYPVFEPKKQGRLTILICTPDSQSPRFVRCYESLIKTTQGIDYDLHIFDNRRRKDFSHAAEINRALAMADGPIITLDDDVTVTGDWLPAMLEAATENVAIVALSVWRNPSHLWSRALSFDAKGKPINWKGEITQPTAVPAACSCCWLINDPDMRMSLDYTKYYFDPDACFHAWHRGQRVIVLPQPVYHEGAGATRDSGGNVAALVDRDRAVFRRTWITSGWLADLRAQYGAIWPEDLQW